MNGENMSDEIQKMEDKQVPKGRIDLIGCGRLGLRIAINLMQGQKLSEHLTVKKLMAAT